MKDVTMLLTEAQITRFESEMTMTDRHGQWAIHREENREWGDWFLQGEMGDWSGFMDDQGDFIPTDWC